MPAILTLPENMATKFTSVFDPLPRLDQNPPSMWNPFRANSNCPVDPDQQKWVDYRFGWLEQQFGSEAAKNCPVILPTPEYFPDPYNGTQSDGQQMFERICRYMNVDPARFKLFIYTENDLSDLRTAGYRSVNGTAGLYMRANPSAGPGAVSSIGVESRQLIDPMGLVATLSHEIAHELLIGQDRISRDEHDHEPLTDLLTVYLGIGIFACNATIKDRGWSDGAWAGWRTSRTGYLDQRMFAYAMAKLAHMRNEHKPEWIKHIRLDVRTPMKQALRHLAESK